MQMGENRCGLTWVFQCCNKIRPPFDFDRTDGVKVGGGVQVRLRDWLQRPADEFIIRWCIIELARK